MRKGIKEELKKFPKLKTMNNVIPGILEKQWSEIQRKLELAKSFTNTVHIDIIDGVFANNTTFLDPIPFKKYSGELFLELHMMVNEPINYVKPFADAGFKRFLGHIEKMSDQISFLDEARHYGQAGLAIDGPTSISEISVSLSSLETLLFMDITAGFSGQKFNSIYLEKIKEIKEKGFNGSVEVDGGIDDISIVEAKEAGVDKFISTSYIFSTLNPQENFMKLNQLLGKNSS